MSRAAEPPDTGAFRALAESMKLSSELQRAHTSVTAIWHFCKKASRKSTTQPKEDGSDGTLARTTCQQQCQTTTRP